MKKMLSEFITQPAIRLSATKAETLEILLRTRDGWVLLKRTEIYPSLHSKGGFKRYPLASQIAEERFNATGKAFACGLFFAPAAPSKFYSSSGSRDLCFSLVADHSLLLVNFVPEADPARSGLR